LLRGFEVSAKAVPEGTKFRNTPSACGGDRNFEGFASLLCRKDILFLARNPTNVFQGLMIRLGKNLSLNASNIGGTFNGLASESLFVNLGRSTNLNKNNNG
jgi:hypothetical protein